VVFSSIIFLFCFLPLFLACYHLLPWKQSVLLLFSLVFYAFGEVLYTCVLLLSMALNYAAGLGIARREGRARRFALALSVGGNLLILATFKYLGFLYGVAAGLVPDLLAAPGPEMHLPLGISFFTFHAISYLVDVYRRDVEVETNPVDLAVYITMFPQLVAGPIIRFHTIRDEIHDRSVTVDMFAAGIQVFIIGLAQKVLIANVVAMPADTIFSLHEINRGAAVAWLGIVCYALQIYFDFSGYSLMAIGLGLMIGFHFPQNFDYPYISRSLTEFWRRWHMTLSAWFRDYLYVPLGGNRHGALRTYRNLVIVFLLCGLWHGAAWNFIVWGLYHGAFLVVERAGLRGVLERLPAAVGHAYALLAILIGWVFFRADTLPHAMTYLQGMAGLTALGAPPGLSTYLSTEVVLALAVGCLASTPLPWKAVTGAVRLGASAWARTTEAFYLTGLLALFGLCTVRLAAGTYNPFIYFRF
jgi:alginate O-acetyltransferase complex protein AlgI